MLTEKDIWRAAALMLKRYGSGAVAESEKRASELDAAGDPDGTATWRRIARAAEELARAEPADGVLN